MTNPSDATNDTRFQNLWAPWRYTYVTSSEVERPKSDCFICQAVSETNDRNNLVVTRTVRSVVILNRYPYNNGHLLVAPLTHVGKLDELTAEDMLDQLETIRRMNGILQQLMKPDGFNVGLNLGRAAGAGLPGHLHWHIVPRWSGDTNFMACIADVRVIVQSLDSLWQLLTERLDAGERVSG